MWTETSPGLQLRTRRPLRSAARSGFTVIELLIAMLLTTIVVGGTYFMFASSSEVFHHQELAAENQNNVRFAVEQLKRDIERAGFQGTPNAAKDPLVCPKPSITVPGLMVFEETITDASLVSSITYDAIVTIGDMGLNPPISVKSIGGTTIILDPPAGYTESLFEAEYSPPRIVRVVNPDGIAQFAEVSSIDTSGFSINLSTPLIEAGTGACGVMPMAGENHEVNPLTGYAYRLALDPNEAGKVDLVRERVDPASASFDTVDGTRVTIAEYVVGLRFVPVGVAAGGSPTDPSVAEVDDTDLRDLDTSTPTSGSVLTDISTRPEAARYVIYRIETRTRRGLPRRLAVPDSIMNASTAETIYYEMPNNKFAEVRTIQGRIELPNFVIRNLR